MKASYCKYNLIFKQPAGTSRGVLKTKETFFLKVEDEEVPGVYGLGECAVFRGLSADDTPEYEQKLKELCENVSAGQPTDLTRFPSMQFGFETALYDFANGGRRIVFPSEFTEGKAEVPINGLIWMGSQDEMISRIDDKLKSGFTTIKIKVGAIDFDSELDLIKHIRKVFPPEAVTIRLDANGGFSLNDAMDKLERLSIYGIHSIEQPIKAGQWDEMGKLCANSPIPIALDEELIGLFKTSERIDMLNAVKPAFLILKPSLIGGFTESLEWMRLAAERGVGGWVTSALESNIGLNAFAQWTASMCPVMAQGLGTGALFTNNIESPLEQFGETLSFDPSKEWKYPEFDWK